MMFVCVTGREDSDAVLGTGRAVASQVNFQSGGLYA